MGLPNNPVLGLLKHQTPNPNPDTTTTPTTPHHKDYGHHTRDPMVSPLPLFEDLLDCV